MPFVEKNRRMVGLTSFEKDERRLLEVRLFLGASSAVDHGDWKCLEGDWYRPAGGGGGNSFTSFLFL